MAPQPTIFATAGNQFHARNLRASKTQIWQSLDASISCSVRKFPPSSRLLEDSFDMQKPPVVAFLDERCVNTQFESSQTRHLRTTNAYKQKSIQI